MVVAGVMSGTSADGVDVALCRIAPGTQEGDGPRVRLIGLLETAYPRLVRAAVLRVMEGEAVTAAEMSRLNWRLGEIYADCVEKAAEKFGVRVGLVGCHGQTVQHEAGGAGLGRGAIDLADGRGGGDCRADAMPGGERLPSGGSGGGRGGCAAGADAGLVYVSVGEGEPGVAEPGRDWEPDGRTGGGGVDEVMAFDTGPGNMVVGRCMATCMGRSTTARGRWRGGDGC